MAYITGIKNKEAANYGCKKVNSTMTSFRQMLKYSWQMPTDAGRIRKKSLLL